MKKILVVVALLVFVLVLSSCDPENMKEPTSESEVEAQLINSTTQEVTPTVAPSSAMENDERVGADNVFLVGDRVMLVTENFCIEERDHSVDLINRLFSQLPDKLNKYFMLIPTRVDFEVDEVKALAADFFEIEEYMIQKINCLVKIVDVYYSLKTYTGDINDIFFRTDHHWTQLGAYYGLESFYQLAGVPYHTLDEYQKLEGTPFYDYVFTLSGASYDEIEANPLIYYQLNDKQTTVTRTLKNTETGEFSEETLALMDPSRVGYNFFVGQSLFYNIKVPGNENSDRAVLLIADSSAYPAIPFLADNFRYVIMFDVRYIAESKEEINAVIDEYDITDVVLMVRFDTPLPAII